jgi:arylsulfatase A-like enzyme
VTAAPASAQQPQPNILFILAGNIGYGDMRAYRHDAFLKL